METPTTLPDYQLGEVLGRGAFGSVYRAFKWATGETIAVKQISLSEIPASELPDLMLEIDLLKNLHHENIVRYYGFVKTPEYLFILLELCENGSLQTILKRFGCFPESLVALYVFQVLSGLVYLHEQGVIHRDLKAANILADKSGLVRLADFGVATRVGATRAQATAGSPYWMAPEVVDQTGATTASDIWSLGALVIELITGKPPYHFLHPMPALFRIVNDDCPPIPESASTVVRDFLLQCFQKDRNLRVSAKKLLRHPWMLAAKRQMDSAKRETTQSRPSSGVDFDETVQKVQEWNKNLEAPPPSRARAPLEDHRMRSAEVVSALAKDSQDAPKAEPTRRNAPLPAALARSELGDIEEEAEEDNWDDDFEGSIASSRVKEPDARPSRLYEDESSQNFATIRPSSRASSRSRQQSIATSSQDYSDLVEDDDAFATAVSSMQRTRKQIIRPRDLSHDSGLEASFRSRPSTPTRAMASSIRSPAPATPRSAGHKFSEETEEDYSDVFGNSFTAQVRRPPLLLNTRLSDRSWLGNDDSDEEDPFAEVEENALETDLETSLRREQLARGLSRVTDILEAMSTQLEPSRLMDCALELVDLCEDTPDVKPHFVKHHGVLLVLELLKSSQRRQVIGVLLRIVNVVISSDPETLEKLCLIGGCPLVMSFASAEYGREIRLEAALFIGSMCRTSLLTLQIFVSCQGLQVLVGMIREDYTQHKDLVWMAVDGLSRVLELNGPTPRTDYCRILANEGLLEPLSTALLQAAGDDDDLAESAEAKIANILLVFAQCDKSVKEKVATKSIVTRVIGAHALVDEELATVLLKSVKNLSMLPTALDVFEKAGSIPMLVNVLIHPPSNERLASEACNHAINTLYNLCRLSPRRQEAAVAAGAVPFFQDVARSGSPLKEFVLPMLCDFAHTPARSVLWRYDTLGFYLSLLSDSFWVTPALEAILAWLQEETVRVEHVLLGRPALDAFLRAFCKSKGTTFDNILEPFHRILRASVGLTMRLSFQNDFFQRIIDRLLKSTQAVARLNLLRLTKTVFDSLGSRQARFTRIPGLWDTVSKLAEEDAAVLVKELARELSDSLAQARAHERQETPALRRAGSEQGASVLRRATNLFNRRVT